jgi:hypothetical protein
LSGFGTPLGCPFGKCDEQPFFFLLLHYLKSSSSTLIDGTGHGIFGWVAIEGRIDWEILSYQMSEAGITDPS